MLFPVEPNWAMNEKLDAQNLKLFNSSLVGYHGKCRKENYQVPDNSTYPEHTTTFGLEGFQPLNVISSFTLQPSNQKFRPSRDSSFRCADHI
jgi:hypothetical protein